MTTLAESSITAQAIITHSLKLSGQIEPGTAPTTNETADGLIALNMLLDSMRNEGLLCVARKIEPFTLVGGTSLYTIGTTGTFVTDRPVKIDAAYITYQSYSYPVKIINEQQYAALRYKTLAAEYPTTLFYSPAVPLGNIYLHPVPTIASTLSLVTWTPHLLFSSSSTAVFLAPGFQEFLASQLAVNIAPMYQREASPTVVNMARRAKAGIMKTNTRPTRAYVNLPTQNRDGVYNILTD